jgi:hypothetical protein
MTRKKEVTTGALHNRPFPAQPFDAADWVDWDQWQSTEELQSLMNELADTSHIGEDSLSGSTDEATQQGHIARQIQRHGLEIDG